MPSNNKRRVVWEKWVNPLSKPRPKFEGDDDFIAYREEFHDLIDDDPFEGKMMMTAEGMVPIHENGHIEKKYNLWLIHTNFQILKTDIICIKAGDVPGIEMIKVFSPYRAWIAVAKLFDEKEVQDDLTKFLCKEIVTSPDKKQETVPVSGSIETVLAAKYEFWAIFQTEDGKTKWASGKTADELKENMAKFKIKSVVKQNAKKNA